MVDLGLEFEDSGDGAHSSAKVLNAAGFAGNGCSRNSVKQLQLQQATTITTSHLGTTPNYTDINGACPYPTPTTAKFGGFPQQMQIEQVNPTPRPTRATVNHSIESVQNLPADEQQKYSLTGLLQHDDEVLKGLLNYSRRGPKGHCSRDSADIWVYILQLFFKQHDGFFINVQGYHQDESDSMDVDDDEDADGSTDECLDSDSGDRSKETGAGAPVWIEVWKQTSYWDHFHKSFVLCPAVPILTLVCASEEARFTEFPTIRHKGTHLNAIHAPTSTFLLSQLQQKMSSLIQAHKTIVVNARKSGSIQKAEALRSLTGGVACGISVRFYCCKLIDTMNGWVTPQSAHGLDLVNGSPSYALSSVERILSRVARSGMGK